MFDFILFIGAARHDANPHQLRQITDRVLPMLEGEFQETGDTLPVKAVIYEIMGPKWEPSGEWKLL